MDILIPQMISGTLYRVRRRTLFTTLGAPQLELYLGRGSIITFLERNLELYMEGQRLQWSYPQCTVLYEDKVLFRGYNSELEFPGDPFFEEL